MPRTTLAFGITPDVDTFTPTLGGIESRAIDIAPCYEALWTAFRRIEQKRFESEGPGWAALLTSTVADRERQGYGGEHPILNRDGTLRRSLTTKGAKDSVMTPMPDGVFFGTRSKIAGYHQAGTEKMVARPLVDLTEADAEVFGGIIGEWVYGYSVASETFAATEGAL